MSGDSELASVASDDAPEELERRDDGWLPLLGRLRRARHAPHVNAELPVAPRWGQQVVDLAYLPVGQRTALAAAARELGRHPCADGLDVLLAQGAAAFQIWTGLPAPLVAMRNALSGG